MRSRFPALSPPMAVSLLALFVSLGGVSYGLAVGSIGSREIENGSIQSRDSRNGAIRGEDVRNATVLSRDVKDGALRGADVRNHTLRGRDIAPGTIGTGELADGGILGSDVRPNALGDRQIDETKLDVNRLGGVPASRYVKRVTRVVTASASDTTTPKVSPPAACPRGKRVVGGGARVVAAAPVPVALSSSLPSGQAWTAAAYATAPTTTAWQLQSLAICG